MTTTSPAQAAFSSGEISPLLRTRFDYQRFQTGLAACRGFIPLLQGGVTRAPGTIFRGKPRNDQVRLINFEFAANDSLVLEFTHLRMRVWRYGELVASAANPALPYELVTPYDAASLERLQWVQSADVIWIVDGQRPIQRLARYALNNWTIGPAPIDAGPFRVQNLDKNRRIRASDRTGTVTLTASTGLFEASHVGALFMLNVEDYENIPLWTGNTEISVGQLMRYGGRVYELVAGDNTGVNPPQHTEGTERVAYAGNVRWKFISDGSGVVRITAVANSLTATAQVVKDLSPAVVDRPTYRWSEGAWSARHGYPAAIEMQEQRLVAAATPTDPRTIWFSTVGDFTGFEPGTEADSAFSYSISGGASINRILWLKSGRDGLHIGALGEEHSSYLPDRGQPMSATNIAFRFGSSYGSRSNVRPIAPDGLPIFVSKDGARLVEIAYSLENDANVANELSRPSDHLGREGFAEVVWQGAPQRQAWIRTDKGELIVVVYDRAEEVLGWAPCPVAGGFVLSLAVTRDQSGSREVMTMAVRRRVNGVDQVFIEEQAATFGLFAGQHDISEAIHFYSSLVFADPAGVDSFHVPHLIGAAVFAWTDTGQFGPLTVSADGNLTLPIEVRSAVIGLLDETHHVRSLPFVPPTNSGSSLHRRKRMSPPTGIGLYQSAAAKAAIVESDFGQTDREWPLQNIIPRTVAADLTTAFTGITRAVLTSGYADELALKIVPEGGAPLTITAIVPTLTEAGI